MVRKVAFEISDNSIQASSSYAGPSVLYFTLTYYFTLTVTLSFHGNGNTSAGRMLIKLRQVRQHALKRKVDQFTDGNQELKT